MHKKTQLSIILILVLTYLLPVKHGYILGSTWEHFVYIFFHANIFHLAGNCYCTWLILKNNNSKTLIPLYTLSVLASFIAYNNLPTIGFSAPLFVALGINFHKTKNKKTYIPLLISVLASLPFPLVNTRLHVTCFILGYLYTTLKHFIKEISHDNSRINCRE